MTDTNITFVGNLVADPAIRFTDSGVTVGNFRMASTPRKFNKQTNQWEDEEATFLTVNVWRQLAENVAETFSKGMSVIVVGRLKSRTYQTNEGESRTVMEIEAEDVGPSLRYATAKVARVQQGQGGQRPQQGQGGFSPDQGQQGGFGQAPAPQQGGFNSQGQGQQPQQGGFGGQQQPQGGYNPQAAAAAQGGFNNPQASAWDNQAQPGF